MRTLFLFIISAVAILGICCNGLSPQWITTSMFQKNEKIVQQVVDSLIALYPSIDAEIAAKGVQQAAKLWTDTDGNETEFTSFCLNNYVYDEQEREKLFLTFSNKLEFILGSFNLMDLKLKVPIQETGTEPLPIDYEMGSYDAGAHFKDDMFTNKVAFTIILNFPAYTLQEKEEFGEKWTRLQWGYARMGEVFVARIPAAVQQNVAATLAEADKYIADYNIMMGELRSDSGKILFPKDMKLLSHWNLRDEIKSNYADTARGVEKQLMIYEVMKRIVTQEIPKQIIDCSNLQWNPFTNTVFENGAQIAALPEPDTRYSVLLNNFKALRTEDAFTPSHPDYICRSFNGGMEFSKDEIKETFVQFISLEQMKKIAELIVARLGRELKPFDIWYDGFKARSSMSENELTIKTQKLYPNAAAFEKALPLILQNLGFSPANAKHICDKIEVDAARGSGHAWGAAMKGDKAHLRTRIATTGMDYKGYNIAIHEFGHNVEQTISLYDMDYYMVNGVPNTAFTEALAFIFQKRDLEILGIHEKNPNREHSKTLDIFWGCYEIMGVALVDISVWEWMYANPDATPAQLKQNTLRIAREIWNNYYAHIFGEHDSPILAIYSHMITNPLYLANYPLGHLIEFQLEEFIQNKDFAFEIQRIYRLGRLAPQLWMKRATGNQLTIEPMVKAADEALKILNMQL